MLRETNVIRFDLNILNLRLLITIFSGLESCLLEIEVLKGLRLLHRLLALFGLCYLCHAWRLDELAAKVLLIP